MVTWSRGQGAAMVPRQKGDDRKPWQSKADHLMEAGKQRKMPGESSGVLKVQPERTASSNMPYFP